MITTPPYYAKDTYSSLSCYLDPKVSPNYLQLGLFLRRLVERKKVLWFVLDPLVRSARSLVRFSLDC